jgi:hypothetical protein
LKGVGRDLCDGTIPEFDLKGQDMHRNLKLAGVPAQCVQISHQWHYRSVRKTNLLVLRMAVFWVVAPCSLVEFYQRFRGPCCLHHQGDE